MHSMPEKGKGMMALVLGPPAKVGSEGESASEPREGGEDLAGKAAARALRRAIQGDSDGAILAAFKQLYAHCAGEKGGGYGSEREGSAEGS